MGFLHEGHLSLVRRARRDNDVVVASIFVNPLQFGPGEDFESYPRDLARDRRLLRSEGVDFVYEPAAADLYPREFATRVVVDGLDQALCGTRRPGHFAGVTTIVTKLLNAAGPDRLYLGQKDFQQAVILTRMVEDLDFAVKVVVCPTVREADGLAMSSRNSYLTTEERAFAPELFRALSKVRKLVQAGEIKTAASAVKRVESLLKDGPGRIDYIEILSREDLGRVRKLSGKLVLAVAYYLGKARLIDNVWIQAPKGS